MTRLWDWLASFKQGKLIWWLLVAAGGIFYCRQYLADRALWRDEASLALNLVNRSFSGLALPLDYHQAAPVGFLLVEKFFLTLFGNSEYTLRLFPLLAGILWLYLLYRLAREYFGIVGIVALLLVAGNVWLNRYASEFKQYGTDVFIALLLTYLGMRCYSENPNRREYVWLGIAGVAAVWFSHVAIFILAGIGIALVIEKLFGRLQVPFLWLVALGAAWLISFGLHYLLILQYTAADGYFQRFWQSAFIPWPPWRNLDWFLKTYEAFLLTLYSRTYPILFYLTLFLSFLGLLSLFVRNRMLAWLMLFPFVMISIASALQKYPLTYRFMLFLIPFVFLLIAEGVAMIYRSVSKWRQDAALVIAMIPIAILLWYSAPSTLNRIRTPQLSADIRPVMEYVSENRQPGDIVYVYHSAAPTFLYYAPFYNLDSDNIVIQQDVWSKKKDLENFFKGVKKLKGNDRVWIIISEIIDCGGCEGDPLDYFVDSLNAYGSLLDQVESPSQAGGYLYDLNP